MLYKNSEDNQTQSKQAGQTHTVVYIKDSQTYCTPHTTDRLNKNVAICVP